MNAEKVGGTFLLQEQEPKKLIGALVSTTSERNPGWIWGTFGDDSRSKSRSRNEIVLSRDVALHLVALLQVLVAQNMSLRHESARWTCGEAVSAGFSVRLEKGDRAMVYVSWGATQDGIVWKEQDAQFEWGVREDRALELSYALVVAFAKVAAANST